jgi:hypothetical protein
MELDESLVQQLRDRAAAYATPVELASLVHERVNQGADVWFPG